MVIWTRHGRLYSRGNIAGTYFFYRLIRTQVYSAAGRIKSIKIPMNLSGIEPTTFRLLELQLTVPLHNLELTYRGADKSLARPGRK